MLAGCSIAQAGVQGSGKSTTQIRQVADFHAITVTGSFDVAVEVGPATHVEVVADDNLQPMIKTVVTDGGLVIYTKGSFQTKTPIRVTVTTPSLDELTATGSGDVSVRGVRTAFAVSETGSGDITLAGAVPSLDAVLSGSGAIRASGTEAERVAAVLTGSGDIEVRATHAIDARVTGSGDITIDGRPPNVTKSVTGSGDITLR